MCTLRELTLTSTTRSRWYEAHVKKLRDLAEALLYKVVDRERLEASQTITSSFPSNDWTLPVSTTDVRILSMPLSISLWFYGSCTVANCQFFGL